MCSSGAYTGQPKSSFCLTHNVCKTLACWHTHHSVTIKEILSNVKYFIVQGWNMLDLYVQGWKISYTLNSLCKRSSKSCTQSIGI